MFSPNKWHKRVVTTQTMPPAETEWLCNQLKLKTRLKKMFLHIILLRLEFIYKVTLNLEWQRSEGLATLTFLFAEHQTSLVCAISYIVMCMQTPQALCAAPKTRAPARRSRWKKTLRSPWAAKLICQLKQTAETLREGSLKLSKRDLIGVLIKVVFSSWKV